MRVRPLIALVLTALTLQLQAQQFPNNQEQRLLSLTNQVRVEQGLQPLRWDPALAAAAQAHAQQMFARRSIAHQFPGEPGLQARAADAGARFREIAENVAVGASAETVQREWMNSPPHRANILRPTLSNIGVGVIERAGYWYAVVDFDSAVQYLASNQIEQRISGLLSRRGVDASLLPSAARRDCAVDQGDVSGTRPLFIMRWESTTLDRLPPALEQRLSTGKYRTASVGACGNQLAANQGFTTYRIAVLLY